MQDNPRGFSTEADMERVRPQIEATWASRVKGAFVGVDGVRIAYAYVEPPSRKRRAVVLVPGRTEFIDKYMEVVFDLYQQGYASYVIDHRGQGFSDRLLGDRHKGHVQDFEHYVVDLQQFLSDVVGSRESELPVLVGHSMGGAVVARHLQLYPNKAAGAVLCSPMLEINTGAPQSIVGIFLRCLEYCCGSTVEEPPYVPGGIGYEELVYRQRGRLNTLTSSELRFNYMNKQYRENPDVQLGSPTRWWVLQAIKAVQQVLADVGLIQVPVAVLIAGSDRIVRERGAKRFVAALERLKRAPVRCLKVGDAEHELLMEADKYRIPSLNFLIDFVESIDSD